MGTLRPVFYDEDSGRLLFRRHVGGEVAITFDLFGASGDDHQEGLVPDPGASAGSARFLCENRTWTVPTGIGGGGVSDGTYGQVTVSSSGSVWTVQSATTSQLGVVVLATPSSDVTAGHVVQASDARLSDSRAPTGSAGGDLSGTYPNPTLSSAIKAAIESVAETAAEIYSDAALAAHVAASDPHAQYQKESEKDNNSGYAGLDSSGLVGPAHLPAATTSTQGAVVLATPSSDTTAGHAVQASDARLSDARTPTGSAGGDLTGTYPSPTIAAAYTDQATGVALALIQGLYM